MNEKMYTVNETDEQYDKAKESIGIATPNGLSYILVSGENALNLLNLCSVKKIDDKIFSNIYTLFFKNKKILGEVLILRLSLYRFLVITDKFKSVFKLMKKIRRRFQCIVYDAGKDYSLFTFHGINCDKFFRTLDYKYIYKTKHQNYIYYQLLCPKREVDITYRHFLSLNFIPIGNDAEKCFLYNNNVVLHITNIPKRYRNSVAAELYEFQNLYLKVRNIKVVKYELESNELITNRHKVYSYSRRKAGIIHCIYRLPERRFPFIIAFVEEPKVSKVSLIKVGKADALVRPVVFY